MRRIALFALLLSGVPAASAAQPSIAVGGGFTSPIGDFGELADPGYHLTAGVQVGIPTLPVALRLDGSYHRLPAPAAELVAPRVLGGALDVLFLLPGEGVGPYVLAGVGRYRLEAGPADTARTVIRNGFQIGFGVDLGAIAFGGFAEIRLVQIDNGSRSERYVPLTLGVRF